MYLYAEKHYSHSSESFLERFPEYGKENAQYEAIMSGSGMYSLPTPEYGGVSVSKCVGYWRKANAIHGWIVRNIANGVDDCKKVYMSKSDLLLLRDSCVKELSNRDNALPNEKPLTSTIVDNGESDIHKVIMSHIAEESARKNTATELADPLDLQPTAGFFFGNNEKDEYYYECIEYTVDMLNSLLAGADGNYEFYYQASW